MLAFMLAYGFANIVLDRFAFKDGWTILWPLNGITVALLLRRPKKDWPAMLLGVAVGSVFGDHTRGMPISFIVVERVISLLEVLLSACLLPSFTVLQAWLQRPKIYLRFVAALTVGPGFSGIFAAVLYHHQYGQPYGIAFSNWAISDALGIAAAMPLALSLRSPEMRRLFSRQQLARTLSVLTVLFVIATFGFTVSRYPLLFLLYPALLLVESLLAFAGSTIAVAGVCLVAVYCATHGYGTFGLWPQDLLISRDAALQIFLGFHILALFPASIFALERRRLAEELHRTNAQLTTLAALDALTGLGNRRSLDESFALEWARASRMNLPLALIMVDIDHFKQFNDLYGHHAGDLCLRSVAGVLSSHVVRIQDHVARFGGEEFALVLPHTNLEGACALGEKLRSSVRDLAILHEGSESACVTVSVGCSSMTPSGGQDLFTLLQLADTALYKAKRLGRDRVEGIDCPSSDGAGLKHLQFAALSSASDCYTNEDHRASA